MALKLDRLDHFIVAIPDLEPAYEAGAKLGLAITAPAGVADSGSRSSMFFVGPTDSSVVVEYTQAPHDGGDGDMVVFPLPDIDAARDTFGAHGGFTERTVTLPDGATIKSLRPNDSAAGGCNLLFVEYPQAIRDRQAARTDSQHELPLKRVDHIAVIPPDYEAGTRYWTDVLGVPVHAELESRSFVIRQMQVGDLMVELLRPTSDNSPNSSALGMLRVVACEVDDLDACIEHARARGFAVPDAEVGGLPGTIRSTVSADQLAGLSLQLLQRV